MNITPAMRVRATFSKTMAMRFTGHLDVQRAWERALRRGNLPLAYSQGFKPHPKLNLTAPLPLGFTGTNEMIDIWLDYRMELNTVKSKIAAALPPGLWITAVIEVDVFGPKLPSLLMGAVYTIRLQIADPSLDDRVSAFLSQDKHIRERRKKSYDLRPLVKVLRVLPENHNNQQRLLAELSATPGETGRPDEVLYALGLHPHDAHIERTALLLKDPK